MALFLKQKYNLDSVIPNFISNKNSKLNDHRVTSQDMLHYFNKIKADATNMNTQGTTCTTFYILFFKERNKNIKWKYGLDSMKGYY